MTILFPQGNNTTERETYLRVTSNINSISNMKRNMRNWDKNGSSFAYKFASKHPCISHNRATINTVLLIL